jgi:hypothetical protein
MNFKEEVNFLKKNSWQKFFGKWICKINEALFAGGPLAQNSGTIFFLEIFSENELERNIDPFILGGGKGYAFGIPPPWAMPDCNIIPNEKMVQMKVLIIMFSETFTLRRHPLKPTA